MKYYLVVDTFKDNDIHCFKDITKAIYFATSVFGKNFKEDTNIDIYNLTGTNKQEYFSSYEIKKEFHRFFIGNHYKIQIPNYEKYVKLQCGIF